MMTPPKTIAVVLRQEHEGFQFHKAFEHKDWAGKYLQTQDRRDNYETHEVPLYAAVTPEIEAVVAALAKLTSNEKLLLGLVTPPGGAMRKS
jgi:hypothetical protein